MKAHGRNQHKHRSLKPPQIDLSSEAPSRNAMTRFATQEAEHLKLMLHKNIEVDSGSDQRNSIGSLGESHDIRNQNQYTKKSPLIKKSIR